MTTESTDGTEHDALAGPGDDTRIMRSPDEDASSQSASADSDIESSDEATDKSFTTHMDDDDDFSDAVS